MVGLDICSQLILTHTSHFARTIDSFDFFTVLKGHKTNDLGLKPTQQASLCQIIPCGTGSIYNFFMPLYVASDISTALGSDGPVMTTGAFSLPGRLQAVI